MAFHLLVEVDAVLRYIGHLNSRRMGQHAQILQKPEIEEYEIKWRNTEFNSIILKRKAGSTEEDMNMEAKKVTNNYVDKDETG